MFKGTQSAVGEGNVISGDLEEYFFSSVQHLKQFLNASSDTLQELYRAFADESKSLAAVFDQSIVFQAQLRGLYQSIEGILFSSALFLKDVLPF
jgi:hypothetical protein